ncbi:MAG TPA: aspartate ammonia-lyase [Candidatus Nanoarchaeia archaeon]|nr:aspartate ammonia-lyase [Candidatus Nanoarchaeia archaeon]
MSEQFRIEKDVMGSVKVPKESYYGAFTQRAKDNFQISGITAHREFLVALATIKKAAALTNSELGELDKKISDAIAKAADEVISGKFDSYFILDIYQAGAGTPFNMNCNEIIANRATELIGGKLGEYLVNPNNHVNMAQSTNDAIPTAARIAILTMLSDFADELKNFEQSLLKKSLEFKSVLKVGRTHFEDAVPITLGQEFGAYAVAVKKEISRLQICSEELKELGIGGTAVGTGITAHPKFHSTIVKKLIELTKIDLKESENLIELTQNYNSFVQFSGSLRTISLTLFRIANNLSIMNSGPKAGISEIELPDVEPGSSIMPGKINPSIPECVIMVCFDVMGKDKTVENAAQYSILELNVMCPVIAYNLLQSMKILTNALKMFRELCIDGIKANESRCTELLEKSTAIATALNPYIGYQATSKIVKESLKNGRTIRETVLKYNLVDESDLRKILSPEEMTKPKEADRKIIDKIKNNPDFINFISENFK